MKAIILAAGEGKRLKEVSGGLPKSMIEIDDESIIHRQIRSCRDIGIERFVFVLGYKIEQMKDHIRQVLDKENALFVENPIYAQTNTLYSLWLTVDNFDEDFIYFNADVLFQNDLLKKIAAPSRYSQLLLETKSCGEEEVKMIIDEQNRILQIGKKLITADCAGEFIGVGKFKAAVLPEFKKCLQIGIDRGQANNYFEYAVDLLAQKEIIKAVSTEGIPCIEIDFPEDLEKARNLFSS